MDLIDILMARALTPQVQIETAAATARKAVADAADAVSDAEAAVAAAQGVTNIILIQPEEPSDSNVTKVWIDSDSEAVVQLPTVADLSGAIDSITLGVESTSSAAAITKEVKINYPSGQTAQATDGLVKYYTSSGNNTDGTMTQKAITEFVEQSGGDLGAQNAGKIVIVNSDGIIMAGSVTEAALIEALLQNSDVKIEGVLGLSVDYPNKSFARTQEARDLSAGVDFDAYPMYGGRKRCTVADDGSIIAFYGENGYTEDGSNGQVMVYQPKFYYSRIPTSTSNNIVGKVVKKETYAISYTPYPGFKLHPLFKTPSGLELDYVLLSAYESCTYDASESAYSIVDAANVDPDHDLLASISGAKPISGVNKTFTSAVAEKMAQNRGSNWHIMNMAAESANQMLTMIELGTMNSQSAVELGISNITNAININCASITGSTSSLGNATGHAASTVNEQNGTRTTYSENGKRAVSYRGMENPWGNMWRVIGGVNIYGNGAMAGGVPYICDNYTYTPSENSASYHSVGFSLPSVYSWVSAMGYGDPDYDWVIMPAECSNGNSALPVGDNLWTVANLNNTMACLIGGVWNFGDNNGSFYYACDNAPSYSSRSISARLMCVPQAKDAIYNANVAKWTATMEV